MSGGLSWRHQAIIQALLSRGPLKEKDLHSMFEQLTKKNPGTDRRVFDAFILEINKALTCANFELRGCIDQYDGQVYYGVVNTVSDEQSKLGTKYTVPQIAFYKAIIEAIVQDSTANGFITSTQALHLNLESQVHVTGLQTQGSQPQSQGSQLHVPAVLKNFSLSQKQKTLNELVRDLWLNLNPDGNVSLGVKSFLDLRSVFRNNDVPSCQVCNEAGIKAELCKNESCTVRIHHYCLKQLFLQRKGAKACPTCGTSWPFTIPKAEFVQTEDDNEPRESQRATGSKGKRRRANVIVEDEQVESSKQGDQNGSRGSQHDSGLAQRRSRRLRTDATDIGEPNASQSSIGNPDTRRVTRSSRHRL